MLTHKVLPEFVLCCNDCDFCQTEITVARLRVKSDLHFRFHVCLMNAVEFESISLETIFVAVIFFRVLATLFLASLLNRTWISMMCTRLIIACINKLYLSTYS